MCRMLGYIGPAIQPERMITAPRHSLLEQSQHADEAKLAVNGDGFGMAWYVQDDPIPALYRDVMPAWADSNLPDLARIIRSPLFLAHVRAGTTGGTSRANCHPFKWRNWSFCHNGQIGGFAGVRRALEALLPDDLFATRMGNTDSEVLFLLMVANGLDTDPQAAIRTSLSQITEATGDQEQPNRITCLLSDGQRLMGFRHASDARPPSLYVSRDLLDHGGRALASEPLCGRPENWTALPADTLVMLDGSAPQMASVSTKAMAA